VSEQRDLLAVSQAACGTLVRPNSRVDAEVNAQVSTLGEGFPTMHASERALASVSLEMTPQDGASLQLDVAERALEALRTTPTLEVS
jgi:hypothetical protein